MKNDNQLTQLAENYANLEYRIHVEKDECDGQVCWVAKHPELLGCTADGKTQDEAINNLAQVRREYVEILLTEGVEVPLPMPYVEIYRPWCSVPSTPQVQLPASAGGYHRIAPPQVKQVA